MNNTLNDIRLTSEDQYPSTTSVAMTVVSRPIPMPMQNAAIAIALMVSGLNVGFQAPHGVIQLSVTPPAAIAYGTARGDGIVIGDASRNAIRTSGITRTVQHRQSMSPLVEEDVRLAKVARSVTKVKGKTRLNDHRSSLPNIEEEA
jgi:hypothetical protein